MCCALCSTRYCSQCALHCTAHGVRIFYNSHVFQKLQRQEVIFHNNFLYKILGSCCGVIEDFTLLGCYMHSLAVGNWPLEMGINILYQNISTQLLDCTMLHSTAVKASNSNVNSQNTKYHHDKFHIFTQNIQTEGGRNTTALKSKQNQMTESLTSPVCT